MSGSVLGDFSIWEGILHTMNCGNILWKLVGLMMVMVMVMVICGCLELDLELDLWVWKFLGWGKGGRCLIVVGWMREGWRRGAGRAGRGKGTVLGERREDRVWGVEARKLRKGISHGKVRSGM